MAKITLDNLAHSYFPNPTSEEDFALKGVIAGPELDVRELQQCQAIATIHS